MAAGDSALAAVLVGSVFISSPDAARSKVLLFQLISVAPFAVVAPLIGPTVDRVPGGRRFVVQITAMARAALYLVMIFHVDDVILFPLVFGVMVMQKTYAVSKSALVPLVVRDDEELVEANSKLGVIAGLLAAVAIGPLTGLGHIKIGLALVPGAALFCFAAVAARRLPREAVATAPAQVEEKEELRSIGILLAAGGMALIRASVGFLTFHLLFWMRSDYGLAWLGIAVGAGAAGSLFGNAIAPMLRRSAREEAMLTVALALIGITGVLTTIIGGVGSAIVLSAVVNASGSIGRMAFESIVQRDAPDANRGRAFAQFETRFQLSWVLAGVFPVLFTLPGRIGFLVVGLIGVFASFSYIVGSKAARAGKPVPPTLTARARQTLRKEFARRREARRSDPAASSPTAATGRSRFRLRRSPASPPAANRRPASARRDGSAQRDASGRREPSRPVDLPPGAPLPPPKPGDKRR
jgi:hypothetical protein